MRKQAHTIDAVICTIVVVAVSGHLAFTLSQGRLALRTHRPVGVLTAWRRHLSDRFLCSRRPLACISRISNIPQERGPSFKPDALHPACEIGRRSRKILVCPGCSRALRRRPESPHGSLTRRAAHELPLERILAQRARPAPRRHRRLQPTQSRLVESDALTIPLLARQVHDGRMRDPGEPRRGIVRIEQLIRGGGRLARRRAHPMAKPAMILASLIFPAHRASPA